MRFITPKTRKSEPIDLNNVMLSLAEGMRKQINRPNLYAYRPHKKQLKFHSSSAHTRLYIGGNRSGKTTGGVVEDCYWLMKRHPYRRLPLPEGPIRGRAVAVDFKYGVAQILLPEFARWLPPSFLKNGSWEDSFSREFQILTLRNGSTLEFKSYDQDLEKFAGTSRHFCVDEDTKALTKRGWLLHTEITTDDEILTVNPETKRNEWLPVEYIYRGEEHNSLTRLYSRNNIDVMITPEHKWLVYNKKTKKTYLTETKNLKTSEQIIIHGSEVDQKTEIYADEFVQLVGWVVTDGSLMNTNQVAIVQSWTANERKVDAIEELLTSINASFKVYDHNGAWHFYITGDFAKSLRRVVSSKRALTPEFLNDLSTRQLYLLLESILDGDGCRLESGKIMIADDLKYPERMEMYAMLLSMLGRRAKYSVGIASNSYQMMSKTGSSARYDYSKVSVDSLDIRQVPYDGIVWCPNSANRTFYAMKNGNVFLTGNTHFDEEPPQHIYNECMARLVDTNGYSWLTMTPVEGMSWVFDSLYLPGTEKTNPDIEVIEVDMLDNPHITPEAAERYLSTLSDDERKAREHGTFVNLGGLVFKSFNKEIHVVEHQIPPLDWKWYISIDHGFNNPTAILWHAVSPEGKVLTFHCYYEREKTVEDHAAYIHERNREFGRVPDLVIGDPAMKQRQGVTGTSIIQEYALRGVYVAEGNNDVASGIDRMNQYLRPREDNKPTWQITESCGALVWEMQRLRWKRWASKKMEFDNNRQEVIHKKDDHACDSARYFFTIMPDLAPAPVVMPDNSSSIQAHSSMLDARRTGPPTGRIDNNLRRPKTHWKATVGTDIQGLEY